MFVVSLPLFRSKCVQQLRSCRWQIQRRQMKRSLIVPVLRMTLDRIYMRDPMDLKCVCVPKWHGCETGIRLRRGRIQSGSRIIFICSKHAYCIMHDEFEKFFLLRIADIEFYVSTPRKLASVATCMRPICLLALALLQVWQVIIIVVVVIIISWSSHSCSHVAHLLHLQYSKSSL